MTKHEDEFMVISPCAMKSTDEYLVAFRSRSRAKPVFFQLYEEARDARGATQASPTTGRLHSLEDALLLTFDAITVQRPFEAYNVHDFMNLKIIELIWRIQ
jgi:hypothetical protein